MKRNAVFNWMLVLSSVASISVINAQPPGNIPRDRAFGRESIPTDTESVRSKPSAGKIAKQITDRMQDELNIRPKQYAKIFKINVKYAKKALAVMPEPSGDSQSYRQRPSFSDDSLSSRTVPNPHRQGPGNRPAPGQGHPQQPSMQPTMHQRGKKMEFSKDLFCMSLLSEKDQQTWNAKLKNIMDDKQYSRWQFIEQKRDAEKFRQDANTRLEQETVPTKQRAGETE